MITVYIASPYTIGDTAVNVKRQMDVADRLMSAGFAPFAPLLSHFQHMMHPRIYEDWIMLDLVWLSKCDILLRLEGESNGADIEVQHAMNNGISIYYSVPSLLKNEKGV